jgi:hypothetical protein
LARSNAGSVACVATGEVMIVAAIAQDNARDGFALGIAALGAFVVVIGAALPRLREAEVSSGSLKLSLSEREATGELVVKDGGSHRPSASVEQPDTRDAARLVLADRALRDLLRPQEGPLAGCLFRLYLYDADAELLVPVEVSGEPAAADSWPVGRGAVGTAYARGDYVLVEGDDTSDGTYGLTPEQQARYRGLQAVAAMPVTNARSGDGTADGDGTGDGDVIAVLSVASGDPANRIGTPEGFEAHLLVAELVARVLIDLLRWFDDAEG